MNFKFLSGRAKVILNLIIVITFLALLSNAPAYAGAVDKLFDSVAEQMTDSVNKNILKTKVDRETRQLQISATKVLLRGSDTDWDNFVESAMGVVESASETKSSQSNTASNVEQSRRRTLNQYKQAVDQNLRSATKGSTTLPAKPIFFSTMIGGKPINIKASPINPYGNHSFQIKANLLGITSVESDKNPKTREYLLRITYEPANYVYQNYQAFADGIELDEVTRSFLWGEVICIINEDDNEVDTGSAIKLGHGGVVGFPEPEDIMKYISINCPPIYAYDWDMDGIDEIVVLSYAYSHSYAWYELNILRKLESSKEYENFPVTIIESDNDSILSVITDKDKEKEKQSLSNVGVIIDRNRIKLNSVMMSFDGKITLDKARFIQFNQGVLKPIIK
jgi:hypothetical protein